MQRRWTPRRYLSSAMSAPGAARHKLLPLLQRASLDDHGNLYRLQKMHVAVVLPVDVPEYYGFAVDKGNTKVVELLNKGIAAVKAKGIDKELRKKWIGAE